jgi:ubiquinone/menaquinone biosynthesis C-methylase UbiE
VAAGPDDERRSEAVAPMIDADAQLDRIRAQFGKQADVYARMRQTTDERSLSALVQISGADAGSRVLDVACGPGFLTMAFAARCQHAVGVDATEPFLAMARAEAEHRGLRNIEFRNGNAEQLPFGDGAFDLVSCRAAFHHFARPEHVLAEMTRVATPQGRLLIGDMLTSEDPARAEYHNRMERLCDPSHVRALTGTQFDRLFAGGGLAACVRTEVPIDMELEEWLEHGGPDASTAAQIRALIEASIDTDRCGLNVRRENGEIRFTHTAGVFVLQRAA